MPVIYKHFREVFWLCVVFIYVVLVKLIMVRCFLIWRCWYCSSYMVSLYESQIMEFITQWEEAWMWFYPWAFLCNGHAMVLEVYFASWVHLFLQVTEIYNFTQDDLMTEDIFILDCHSEIFVWVGQQANSKNRANALTIGEVTLIWLCWKQNTCTLLNRLVFKVLVSFYVFGLIGTLWRLIPILFCFFPTCWVPIFSMPI